MRKSIIILLTACIMSSCSLFSIKKDDVKLSAAMSLICDVTNGDPSVKSVDCYIPKFNAGVIVDSSENHLNAFNRALESAEKYDIVTTVILIHKSGVDRRYLTEINILLNSKKLAINKNIIVWIITPDKIILRAGINEEISW